MYHIRVEEKWVSVNPRDWCKSAGRCAPGKIPMIYSGKEDMTFDIFEGKSDQSCAAAFGFCVELVTNPRDRSSRQIEEIGRAAIVMYVFWMKERRLIVFTDRPLQGQHWLN